MSNRERPKNYGVKQREQQKAKNASREHSAAAVPYEGSHVQHCEYPNVLSETRKLRELWNCGDDLRVWKDSNGVTVLDQLLLEKICLMKEPTVKSLFIEVVQRLVQRGFICKKWQKHIVKVAQALRVSGSSQRQKQKYLLEQMQLVGLARIGHKFQNDVLGYAATAGPHILWQLLETVACMIVKHQDTIDTQQFKCVIANVKVSPLRLKTHFIQLPEIAMGKIHLCSSDQLDPSLWMLFGLKQPPVLPPSSSSASVVTNTNASESQDGGVMPTQMELLVTQEVEHDEEAAQIPAEEAALLAEAGYASWILHNADAARLPEGAPVSEQPFFEKAYLLRMTRNPRELEAALTHGPELETIRASLLNAGRDVRLPSGALILVAPEQYAAVRRAVSQLALRPFHVVVTDTFLPLVHEALHSIPSRRDVRIREGHTVAYLDPTSPDMNGTIIVENTFLNIPRRLRESSSVVQSTTEAHGGTNPRR